MRVQRFPKTIAELRHMIFPNLQSFFTLTIGALVTALTFVLFFEPTNIAPGGISGLVLVTTHFLPLPEGVTFFMFNIPLLILGFFNLGRFRFLIRTAYVVLVSNTMVDLLDVYLPDAGLSADVLLNTLYGGVGSGIGFGLVLRAGGNSGGTGVLSRVIQLRTSLPLSQIYLFTDGFVILAIGLVFGWENALYSMLALFISGIATDYILEGPNVLRMVFIVTENPEPIASVIRERLYVGITRWEGQGTYSQREKSILFCTVPRSDTETVKALVLEQDPTAFMVVGQAGSRSGGLLKQKELLEKAKDA
jgi:uncharacterized membrane-anchored protein YitT (DUF2179 family)